MESRIGTTLRQARKRRKVSLSELEEATRIRPRFLRAIENEEWDVLPGGVYTRGFIRAYASCVGLDGERLAEDFRREVEEAPGRRGPARELAPVAASTATGSPGGRRSLSSHLRWLAVPAVALVAVIAIVAIPGESDNGPDRSSARQRPADRPEAGVEQAPAALPESVSVRLSTEAEVWVCLLDAEERPLVDGQILAAGAEEGPFRSGSFTVSFGNGEVTMLIDGKQAEIPTTASPLGYSIDSSGQLSELSETERPTCT